MALETETATFERLRADRLAGEEGRFAVIKGDQLVGLFDTYSDGLKAGYDAAGLEPFLIKQVSAFEMVANFTRDFDHCTLPA
jgi:hypothetical protein